MDKHNYNRDYSAVPVEKNPSSGASVRTTIPVGERQHYRWRHFGTIAFVCCLFLLTLFYGECPHRKHHHMRHTPPAVQDPVESESSNASNGAPSHVEVRGAHGGRLHPDVPGRQSHKVRSKFHTGEIPSRTTKKSANHPKSSKKKRSSSKSSPHKKDKSPKNNQGKSAPKKSGKSAKKFFSKEKASKSSKEKDAAKAGRLRPEPSLRGGSQRGPKGHSDHGGQRDSPPKGHAGLMGHSKKHHAGLIQSGSADKSSWSRSSGLSKSARRSKRTDHVDSADDSLLRHDEPNSPGKDLESADLEGKMDSARGEVGFEEKESIELLDGSN